MIVQDLTKPLNQSPVFTQVINIQPTRPLNHDRGQKYLGVHMDVHCSSTWTLNIAAS